MKFKETTYSKREIAVFLNSSGYQYAATCWGVEMNSEPDQVVESKVEKWFKRYFINNAHQVFRNMQCACVGTWEEISK